ncbi:hypothetical protein [Paenibacillus rubinfantis]|uniref:hypothetical protein n=1 Tax=Paenibacillus rubinfantis TaxID=1720296 RepID=UPI00073F397D|nr:hypothetical protein [Paenibacillus rubinfantis]
MAVVTKVDVSIDLQHPVREVSDIITLILGMYPGREIEILRGIDNEVGSALARLEHAAAPAADPEKEQPSE